MKWHWQYAGAVALYAFNVDWVIMPRLKLLGLGNWWLFVITSILAALELFMGYWFWLWFRRVAAQEFAQRAVQSRVIKEAIEVGQQIKGELKKAGLWEKLKNMVINFLFNAYKRATDENSHLMKWLKRGGSGGMFLSGINPEPGTRTAGAIFCGTIGWKNGLYPLTLGSTLRIAYMVGIWDVVFSIFKK